MTRAQMIEQFFKLEDEINSFRMPPQSPKESGHRYLPTSLQEKMNRRQELAFAIARSMPRPKPNEIALVVHNTTPHPVSIDAVVAVRR